MTQDQRPTDSAPRDGGVRSSRRLFLLLGITGGAGAVAGLPYLGKWLFDAWLSHRWRRGDQAIRSEAARIDAENSHGHHSGIALRADPLGFTLLGTTRRGQNLGWLLRVDPEGAVLWERTFSTLEDPALLEATGDGYLIAGSHDETSGGRSYAAALQKAGSDGTPGATRVHPPGGTSSFLAYTEAGGRRYLGGAAGQKARMAELREDLSLEWDRTIPELFQITCLLPRTGGLLALGATQYNTRGPHRGAIVFLSARGDVERILPTYQKGWGHLSRAVRLADGRVLAVGSVQDEEVGDPRGWLVEIDAQGSVREQARSGSHLTALAASPDGGFSVAGVENTGVDRRVILRHYAPGQPAQEVRLATERGAWVADLKVLPDGDRVLIGTTTRLGQGKTNLWLARVAGSGTLRWERGYGAP